MSYQPGTSVWAEIDLARPLPQRKGQPEIQSFPTMFSQPVSSSPFFLPPEWNLIILPEKALSRSAMDCYGHFYKVGLLVHPGNCSIASEETVS